MTVLDINITDEDLTLSAQNNVGFITGIAAVVQDLKHMILETGYLVEMIGQRDTAVRADLRQKIAVKCETDKRLMAGSVSVSETQTGFINISAHVLEEFT